MLLCKYKRPTLFIQNRLTLEQKELCRCRLKLLTYLDRLATYEVRASVTRTSAVYWSVIINALAGLITDILGL